MFDQIPEWFKQTKPGRQMVEEERAKVLTAREELVHAAEVASAKLTAGLPALDKAIEVALAAEVKAAEALKVAAAGVRSVWLAKRDFVRTCERDITRAQSQLYRTADPAIERTIKDLQLAIEKARASGLQVSATSSNPYSGKTIPEESNIAEVIAEVDRLAAISAEVAALLLSAEADVPARIGKLREAAGLPALVPVAA